MDDAMENIPEEERFPEMEDEDEEVTLPVEDPEDE